MSLDVAPLARRQTDFSLRLPKGWLELSPVDQAWVGRDMFVSKGKMTAKLRTWWHPPAVDHSSNVPTPDGYFRRKLFLWMPRKMWFTRLVCDKCRQPLRSKGLSRKVRVVIDVRDTYYLAGEYMDCNTGGCMSTYISWDRRILEQLPDSVLARFPVVLTYRYACDRIVVGPREPQ